MTFRTIVPTPFASWLRRFSFPLSPAALLMISTCAALVWANAFGIASYHAFWEFHRDWLPGTPKEWINDGLMALFFLLIGIEIKRELTVGALDSPARALAPAAAALGGMVVPAGLYLALNWSGDSRGGWGIPMATDIAFVLGILGALGPRASTAGRVFLTALAVVDDIGAILVIAFFYSSGVSIPFLIGAAALIAAMLAINRSGNYGAIPIFVIGIALWACVLKSGVHPTIGGLIAGLLLPQRAGRNDLDRLEHAIEPWVSRAIVPLFALANAGVALGGGRSLISDRVAIGVFLGLALGKPLGIMGSTALLNLISRNKTKNRTPVSALFGFSLLGGVGFTMSLFIAELSFGDAPHADAAKLGILTASAVAGIGGFTVLRREPALSA